MFVFVFKITLPRIHLASLCPARSPNQHASATPPRLWNIPNLRREHSGGLSGQREVQLAYASERLAARTLKFEISKVCKNGVPHRRLGWTQSGSSSKTGVISMGILSVGARGGFAGAVSKHETGTVK